mmetsp:Transcript_82532/g.145598  ORF Transcript_82532/g.145598 Transcript_82532/m.145598 type:complete len:200 (-) Transcript_82532:2-601(-)
MEGDAIHVSLMRLRLGVWTPGSAGVPEIESFVITHGREHPLVLCVPGDVLDRTLVPLGRYEWLRGACNIPDNDQPVFSTAEQQSGLGGVPRQPVAPFGVPVELYLRVGHIKVRLGGVLGDVVHVDGGLWALGCNHVGVLGVGICAMHLLVVRDRLPDVDLRRDRQCILSRQVYVHNQQQVALLASSVSAKDQRLQVGLF